MEIATEQGPKYNLYTYTEDEFKKLLGIYDPGSVLTVERKWGPEVKLTVRIKEENNGSANQEFKVTVEEMK